MTARSQWAMGFSATACLVLLMATASVSAAWAETLTYAGFPPARTFPCVQMERWADEVEKRTGGEITVQTFPGSTLLGAKNMFRGVIQGQADIGCLSIAYQPGVFPLTSVMETPMGFTKSVTASLTLLELYEKYQPAEFDKVKTLTMFTSAPSNIMSKVPVRSLAELQGVEIRASGGAAKVLELLGAVPVSMPMPDTPEALQKGLVKGLLSSLETLMDFNFAEYCRHETITNFQVYPFAVVMNKARWNKLSEEYKKVLEDLRREQSVWTGEYMDGHVVKAIEWSKKKYDIEVHEWSAEDKAEAASRLAGMADDWKKAAAAKGVDAEAVWKDALSLKAKFEAEYGR